MVLNVMAGYLLAVTPVPVSARNNSAGAEGRVAIVNEGMPAVLRQSVRRQVKIAASWSMNHEVFSEPLEMLIARVSASGDLGL
jgi:hypothetical protein